MTGNDMNKVVLIGTVVSPEYVPEEGLKFRLLVKTDLDGDVGMQNHEVYTTKRNQITRLNTGERVCVGGHLGVRRFEVWGGMKLERTVVLASFIQRLDEKEGGR